MTRFDQIPDFVRQSIDELMRACNGKHRSAEQAAALFYLYASIDHALVNASRVARGLPANPPPPSAQAHDAHGSRDKRRSPYGPWRTGTRRT